MLLRIAVIKMNVGVLVKMFKKASLHMTHIHKIYIILSQITVLINVLFRIKSLLRIFFLIREIKIYGISYSFKICF